MLYNRSLVINKALNSRWLACPGHRVLNALNALGAHQVISSPLYNVSNILSYGISRRFFILGIECYANFTFYFLILLVGGIKVNRKVRAFFGL